MRRSTTLAVAATALLCAGFAPASAAEGLKDQLVGTWTLVSWDEMRPDGTKIPPLRGINPKGVLMFDANGHFSFQAIAAIPKIASNDRKKLTRQETWAVSRSSYSYFGAYAVNEDHRNIVLHVERSSFPNMNGTVSGRQITALTADELAFTNPMTLSGRRTQFVWKRAHPAPVAASAAN